MQKDIIRGGREKTPYIGVSWFNHERGDSFVILQNNLLPY
jgi:hypothetical protein